MRSAAWATPVVALAAPAPAYAASPCPPVTLLWSSVPAGTFTSTTVGGVTVSVATTGSNGASGNRTVVQGGDLGGQTSFLQFAAVQGGLFPTSQRITFTFSAPVAGLTFSLLDVDSQNGLLQQQWFDQVSVETAGFAASRGSRVTGAGTAGDPFQPVNADTRVTDASGNVLLTWPLTPTLASVSMTYSQGIIATGPAVIGVGALTFRPLLC